MAGAKFYKEAQLNLCGRKFVDMWIVSKVVCPVQKFLHTVTNYLSRYYKYQILYDKARNIVIKKVEGSLQHSGRPSCV